MPLQRAESAVVSSAPRLATLKSGDGGWILLRPNRSLTRNGLLLSAAAVLGGLIPIVLFFVLLGAWPVLPFLGLEMAVVASAFLWLAHHHDDHEYVLLDSERIVHVRIDGRRRESRSFPRYWARLVIEPGSGRVRAPRLWLRSHGQTAELGRDGNVMTRDALVQALTHEFGVARAQIRSL